MARARQTRAGRVESCESDIKNQLEQKKETKQSAVKHKRGGGGGWPGNFVRAAGGGRGGLVSAIPTEPQRAKKMSEGGPCRETQPRCAGPGSQDVSS